MKTQRDISNSFPKLSLILSIVVVLFIVIENLVSKFQNILYAKAALFIIILLCILIMFFKFRQEFVRICSSIRFAIIILFFILISSVIGTLILQNETFDNYEKFYGSNLYVFLNFLKLTDIFHSYHFRAIVILLCVNILFCVFKRKPFSKVQLGFLLTHLGIIVILLGSSLSSFFQMKGYIHFLKGQTFDEIEITNGDESKQEKLPLGFSIKLSDFNVEMYEKEYRLYLFRREKISDDSSYKVISSYKIRAGDLIKIPDGKTKIGIKGLSSSLDACSDGKYLLAVSSFDKVNEKQFCVGLSEKLDIPGYRYTVELSKFLPHFNFDIETRQYVSISDNPVNPAVFIKIQNKDDPRDSDETWLFSKMPEFGAMHNKKEFPFKLKFKYEAGSPAVKLDVITNKGTTEKILSSEEDKPIFFKNNKYVLAFQEKSEEVKDYKSTLEILEGGKPVKTQIVEVNHPLVYKGFYFYQANYNPENPDYSGIQVVRDPGVYIVYLGFLVLITGLIYIFYLKPLFKKE